MKVAFLLLKGLPFPGGVERYMEEVGPRLAARGHSVLVYSVAYRTKVPERHMGMEVRRVPSVPLRSLEKPTAALLAALREAFGDSDVVHVHAFGPSIFGALPRFMGKRVVIQGHGLEWKRAKWGAVGKGFLRFAEWASMRIAHRLTVVSRTQKAYLEQRYGIHAEFIPPGINLAAYAKPEAIAALGLERGEYILFAARLEREKGLGYLVDAYRKLRTTKKLVIAGDNPLDATYKLEMKKLAADVPNVMFVGFATGRLLQELFSNCYCFVLPSEIEGLPIAALEAMSYGCATVVSDIPENIEAVGRHGVTFRSRDPDDLAVKLRELLADPPRVAAIGEAGRSYVEATFSWDKVAEHLELLYSEIAPK